MQVFFFLMYAFNLLARGWQVPEISFSSFSSRQFFANFLFHSLLFVCLNLMLDFFLKACSYFWRLFLKQTTSITFLHDIVANNYSVMYKTKVFCAFATKRVPLNFWSEFHVWLTLQQTKSGIRHLNHFFVSLVWTVFAF